MFEEVRIIEFILISSIQAWSLYLITSLPSTREEKEGNCPEIKGKYQRFPKKLIDVREYSFLIVVGKERE